MRYDWMGFICAVIIWAFLGFQGKLADVEKKYKYSALIPLIFFGVVIFYFYSK